VHIVSIDEDTVDKTQLWTVSDEEKIEEAIKIKDKANWLYRDQEYDEALITYQKALKCLSKLKKYTKETD